MRYQVVSPYVTLRVPDYITGKQILIGFHVNAILPDGTDADDLARHLRKGMIREFDAPAAAPEPAVEAPAEPAESDAESESARPAKTAKAGR